MNCVVAIGTTVHQGQARTVVVRRMALQAERRLAHRQHILVWRTMGGVTLKAALVYRSVLECERSLIFGVAGETEFVGVGDLQIVTRAPAMRIMTIDARHLRFPNRMVVRQICLGILLLVTPHAVVIHLPTRLNRSWHATGLTLEFVMRPTASLTMNGVAVAALDVLGLVSARKPVPHMIGFRVAA